MKRMKNILFKIELQFENSSIGILLYFFTIKIGNYAFT